MHRQMHNILSCLIFSQFQHFTLSIRSSVFFGSCFWHLLGPANQIAVELGNVCDELILLAKHDEIVIKKVKRLQENSRDIAQWVDDYNYNGVKANGYLSLLMIGLKLGRLCAQRYENVKDPEISNDVSNLLEFALIAVEVLQKLRKDSLLQGR